MESCSDVSSLVDEYHAVFGMAVFDSTESLERVLIRDGDWSPGAAAHLVQLAKSYGSFMLRNALAISLVLEVEDGDLGF